MTAFKWLDSLDPPRQVRFETGGHIFSVVNMIIPPLEEDGTRTNGKYTDLMYAQYHPNIFEAMDQTTGKIVGRYSSVDDAIRIITNRSWEDDDAKNSQKS